MDGLRVLPSGKSITLRPAEEVPERLRRPIARAILRVRQEVEAIRREIPPLAARVEELKKQGAAEDALAAASDDLERKAREFARAATDEEMDAYDTQNDLAAVALVARWDYLEPVSLEAVLNLPHADYDALRAIVAPLTNALFVDADPDPNPAAPGRGSDGSASGSSEAPSTTLPSTGGPSPSSAPA